MRVRFIGLDVHLDFCEVAICEAGRVRSGGRVATSSEGLAILANSLGGDDYVALEATDNALAIARRLEPHVARVVVATRTQLRAITEAKVKTTGATRARWRGCSPPGGWAAAGCRMSRRGRCAGAWRAARNWCGSARAARTRCTRC